MTFDPNHFCRKWQGCCEKNIKLKPKIPNINNNMSLEDSNQILDISSQLYFSIPSGLGSPSFLNCLNSIISEAPSICAKELDINNILEALNKCNCCEYHIKNKPKSLYCKCEVFDLSSNCKCECLNNSIWLWKLKNEKSKLSLKLENEQILSRSEFNKKLD